MKLCLKLSIYPKLGDNEHFFYIFMYKKNLYARSSKCQISHHLVWYCGPNFKNTENHDVLLYGGYIYLYMVNPRCYINVSAKFQNVRIYLQFWGPYPTMRWRILEKIRMAPTMVVDKCCKYIFDYIYMSNLRKPSQVDEHPSK